MLLSKGYFSYQDINVTELAKLIEHIIIEQQDLLRARQAVKQLLQNKQIQKALIRHEISQDSKKMRQAIEYFDQLTQHDILKQIYQEIHAGEINQIRDQNTLSKLASQKNFRKTIQDFLVYQIYKYLNPRRIAGESKLDNYTHNLIKGGQELAGKYEGGSKAELQNYDPVELAKLQLAVKGFNNKKNDRSR